MRKKPLILAVFVLLAVVGCGPQQDAPPSEKAASPEPAASGAQSGDDIRLAFVTNAVDPFWNIAEAGVRAAEKEFNVKCEVLMPAKGLADQQRMVESQMVHGVDGIAISPVDADNQVQFLNEIAKQTKLITMDSDAPNSDRLCFVGMNNYAGGREAGKLVKEALPEGGAVALFVGRLEQLNGKQRRQGIIDELLDRPEQSLDSMTYDPPAAEIKGDKYSIARTFLDNTDQPKAKSNAEDAIASIPELKCMVGLYAYNPPMCYEAVKEAGKLGQIKIVGFDEKDGTLQGIKEGHIHGTVSQQPYLYGYESVRILSELMRGNESVLPENKFLEVDLKIVRQDNVDEFWAELKELKGE